MFNTFRDKLRMYDTMLANLISKDMMLLSEDKVDSESLYMGYNFIESEEYITRYFAIHKLPSYIHSQLLSRIREECIYNGVKINAYMTTEPYYIPWESAEMKSRLNIWNNAIGGQQTELGAFNFRQGFNDKNNKNAIMWSTLYFNKAELEHKRTVCKMSLVISFSSKKDRESRVSLTCAIRDFKRYCATNDIKVKELSLNLIDWCSHLSMFSTSKVGQINKQLAKFTVTDDVIAQFSTYRQGRLGYTGINMGMDILSGFPVLKKFKEDPNAAENMIIAAETGGGKSLTVKDKIPQFLAEGMTVTVIDYEGDEYTNMAAYLGAGNKDYVKIVSMGKDDAMYFDPMEIGDITGEVEIDSTLKSQAMGYVLAYFRTILDNPSGKLTRAQERVISTALKNVYDRAGITEDKHTWVKSKGLRIKMVYEEIKRLKESGELVDTDDITNSKLQASVEIIDSCYVYFEEGEAKAGTFARPMSLNELCESKFIIFQFGMKGATASQTDPIVLALKQLSVANISIQISNYCKYVLRCFNVKIWEEFQRWGEIRGSSEIIVNAMTGGRKRGDINILVTNDIADMLNETNKVAVTLTQNINIKMIGGIADSKVREKACERFGLKEVEHILARISTANQTKTSSNSAKFMKAKKNRQDRYRHVFCLVMGSDKAFVKVMLPDELLDTDLFKTGVNVEMES